MTSYKLMENYIKNLEALLRKKRSPPPLLTTCPLGPLLTLGMGTSSSIPASSCWCRQTNSMVCLQHFLELCKMIVIKDVAPESIRLCLFPFSLSGKAKQWFYKEKEAIKTWDKCSTVFLAKFFPMGKTNALRGRISNF